MHNKRIQIIGAGGPAGVGMTRCLKEHYTVTGEDSSQWAELMMECEKSDRYMQDLVIPLPDSMISGLSRSPVKIEHYFLPSKEQIELCQDKAKTAEVLGDLAPKTYWVRDTHGAGGSGAQMCSEMLPGNNYSAEFVIFRGEVLAYFIKKRISYSVKSKTQGIDNRGSSAVSVVVNGRIVYDRALKAIDMVAAKTHTEMHGFYGVDLKCAEDGRPKVTEINAGRLLTASYEFFRGTGYNLPLMGVKAFFKEELPVLPEYPLGWGQIRQVGQLPKLFPPEVAVSW